MKPLFSVLMILVIISIIGCTKVAIIEKQCPENVIIDRLKLNDCIGFEGYALKCYLPADTTQKWLDDTTIYRGMPCKTGHEEGENVNYIYCNDLFYSKTPISEEGVIQKTIEYDIKLVLDSKDKTDKGYKVISSKCY